MLTVAPPAARAEGARQVFDCVTTQTCDAAGACAAGGPAVTFTLSPLATGPEGEGDYRIAYDGREAEARNLTGLGPITWAEGADDAQTLLISGEGALLWHRLSLADGTASVTFLACEVTQ